MARVKKAVEGLRARIANCSVKAAFALYAAIAIITAIALTGAFSVVASLVAESTIEYPYAYSGTFVFDEASNSLVPAETLSWYEVPASESLYGQDGTEAPEGESAGTGTVFLYVEGSSRADSKPITLGNPPATVPDGTILDVSWTASASDVYDDPLSFSEIAAYDAAEHPARPGFDAALALAEQLPDNANGEKPIVSNVAYYVPYPSDSPAYRAVAGATSPRCPSSSSPASSWRAGSSTETASPAPSPPWRKRRPRSPTETSTSIWNRSETTSSGGCAPASRTCAPNSPDRRAKS